ncbi:hypothetical protein OG589_28500 [Sphaerisporangium sp. NBC_01403]|uniref:hypothetical protein n=1 Tax=Sphaerisporangium sp. NBC_01403 TaxID=2903599 RepID=UPI00324F0687
MLTALAVANQTIAVIGPLLGGPFGQRADTGGMHHLAWIMLGAGVVYLLLTVFDRTLGRATDGDTSADTPQAP